VLDPLALPDVFWESPDTVGVLAARDVGGLFRLVRRSTGASQTQIGIATGLSQAQVSEIMGGTRRVTSIEVLSRIVTGLHMPRSASDVLFLGDRSPAAAVHIPAANRLAAAPVARSPVRSDSAGPCADVTAVYASRSEFTSRMPPHVLFDGAKRVWAAGLSLNLLCQQYADGSLRQLVTDGAHLRLMFLDPEGTAVTAREQEEGYPAGHLASLTRLNIQNLIRHVRDVLPDEHRANLQIAVYDETLRFNIVLVDEHLCVAQPYLPDSRGVNAPTFVLDRRAATHGLYPVFEQVFTALWQRSRPL
jgi:transcriptional regulator with XRE-family HTH domain